MVKCQQGNWAPVDSKNIVASVRRVFESQDITKLSKKAYEFITGQMGFIAHYSLPGFQNTYPDIAEFAEKLQSSEYGHSKDYNLGEADRFEADSDFQKWYGEAYNKSKAKAIRGIVAEARKFEAKYRVEEKTVLVPHKIRVLVAR